MDIQRVLLIMPFFMGYEKDLVACLQEKYQVTLLDSEELGESIRNKFYGNKIRNQIRKIDRKLVARDIYSSEESYSSQFLKSHKIDNQKFDIVLTINGHYIPNSVYEVIKKSNPEATFVLYLWDDADNLFKTTHFKYFEKKYSYNLDDCKKYSMSYLPMFTRITYLGHDKDLYDFSIIASAYADRISIAKKLYWQYSDQFRFFIYFYQDPVKEDFYCYNEPISYDQYISILRHSKCLIDIPHPKQQGPTTRAFDTVQTDTKLLTTNTNIINYPIYSSNIEIIDRNEPVLPLDFINTPYINNGKKVHTTNQWIEAIGL
jgi:hypothetical protein